MHLVERIKKSLFIRNVATLASGTAIAQVILLLASPILTRLYSPEAFGMLAVFMTFIISCESSSTGKYEMALMLPKRNNMAVELYVVAVWVGVFGSILLFIFYLLFQGRMLVWLNASEIINWILIAPVLIFLIGLSRLGGYFANRNKQYGNMAKSRIIQEIARVGGMIILGIMGVGFLGLLIGNIFGFAVAFIYLALRQRIFLSGIQLNWSNRKVALARRYIEFPIYNASTAFLDGIRLCLPIYFLAHNFSADAVGYYAFVVRVISAPFGFISVSVSMVNLKKTVDIIRDKKRIEPYLYKLAFGLFLFSVPLAIALVLWGPKLFSLVFGGDWLEAGRYARILAWSIVAGFIANTLGSTIEATLQIRYGAFWKVTAFISTLLVLGIVSRIGTIEETLIALVINDIALYSFHFYLVVKAAKNPKN
jgi:O-antigen/teichoic acid export membrane protein